MKNWFLNIAASAVVLLSFTACEKDETKVTIATAGAPVLTASATTATLSQPMANDNAVKYTWAPANFGFAAATTYTLQFDKKGGNFSKPISINAGSATTRTLRVTELNDIFINLGLPADAAAQVDVRVLASVGTTAPTQASAVSTIAATPYDFCAIPKDSWGLVGPAGDGWPGATATDIVLPYDCKARAYVLRMPLNAGPFKFRANKDWGTNLGGAGNLTSGVPLTLNGSDLTIATAGTYTVKLVVAVDAADKVTGGTLTVTP
ncbi:SusE domain-containing protein [Hymenobacter glacialis]|nr:SusE domain-containing protein [Hymenobacter glacialis]